MTAAIGVITLTVIGVIRGHPELTTIAGLVVGTIAVAGVENYLKTHDPSYRGFRLAPLLTWSSGFVGACAIELYVLYGPSAEGVARADIVAIALFAGVFVAATAAGVAVHARRLIKHLRSHSVGD